MYLITLLPRLIQYNFSLQTLSSHYYYEFQKATSHFHFYTHIKQITISHIPPPPPQGKPHISFRSSYKHILVHMIYHLFLYVYVFNHTFDLLIIKVFVRSLPF